MNLYQANNQWATRPNDERFKTLKEMNQACRDYMSSAVEAEVNLGDIRVEPSNSGEDLQIVGRESAPAKLSHYSMGQLSRRISAPAEYLRGLPATLAAQNLNHGLKERARDPNQTQDAKLLFHQLDDGALVVRAATSEKYTRIWNAEITQRLVEFQENNPQWVNPMAYAVDIPSNGNAAPVRTSGGMMFPAVGSTSRDMVPSGLYASDHDMFVFLVDESKALDGSPKGLNRGFFMWNSEVGDKSFGGAFFLYDRVCGNNIVWGAENVTDFRIRHVGDADARAWSQIRIELRRYADASGAQAESMIAQARETILGGTKADALDTLLKMVSAVKAPELTATRLTDALELAEKREDRYGNPRSLWAAVGGITELSQQKAYADERVKIDRAAGKLLKTIKF